MTLSEKFILACKLGMLFLSVLFFSVVLIYLSSSLYDRATAFGIASIAAYTISDIWRKS